MNPQWPRFVDNQPLAEALASFHTISGGARVENRTAHNGIGIH
jgi:hypothetical protein